jgi:putative hydrolase of the HAD superfamily
LVTNASVEIVFLDAGETILHPHPSFPELFVEVVGRHGTTLSVEDVAAAQQRLAPHLVDIAEDTGVENPSFTAEDAHRFWTFLYRRLLEELGVPDERLVEELFATFSAAESYRLFDDVTAALDRLLERGYRLGLISNFEGWLEKMLMELEVGHLFEISVISGVERIEKPDPAIYRLALERAGVEPRLAVHVGDSVSLDVEPARSVGMHAVLLDRVGRYDHVPYVRIASLEELPDAIEKL